MSEACAVANALSIPPISGTEADRVVGGVRTEIKSSTLWKQGVYKFQQLRDQNYEIAICLGISPFEAHCWVLPKPLIMQMWGAKGGLQSQHGGRQGTDTAWLSVDPGNVPAWLRACGGSLSDGLAQLQTLLRGTG